MQGEELFWEHASLIDFLTFPKTRGGISHSPFLLKEYASVLSISVYLYLVPEFREGRNLQLHVSATINLDEDDLLILVSEICVPLCLCPSEAFFMHLTISSLVIIVA